MTKKWFVLLIGIVVLPFFFSLTPLAAQEKEEAQVDVMDMSLEDLLNVEITTAGKQTEKIGEIPASIVLVTREDIETYGYQTLAEILENIPGLYQTDDFFVKSFGVRGFWNVDPLRNVIILVNGVKQTEDLTSANYLQQINLPPESIDRIEVVRGPMSVVYGAGAFFGVINIFTNQENEKEPVNMVSASLGSEKTGKVFIRASGNSGDFQYAFNGSYYDTAGIDEPLSKMVRSTAVLPSFGLPENQTTKDQLENSEKYFNFSGAFKGFTFDTSYTESKKEIMGVLPSVSEGTLAFNKAMRLSFGYEKKFSEKVRVKLGFGYYLNRQTFNYDWIVPTLYGIQNNQSSGYNAEVNLFFDPSPKLNLTVGIEYRKVTDAAKSVWIPTFALTYDHNTLADGESIVTQAIFTQVNFRLSKKFKIVAGARVEQVPEYTIRHYVGIDDPTNPLYGTYTEKTATYSHTTVEFIPRLALIYSINEDNVLKFLYGQAINRPSFFMNRDLLLVPDREPLKPETIQTFELNYIGQLSSKFSVSISIFHNMLDRLIYRTLEVVEGAIVQYYSNVREMTTNGAELTINTRPFNNFRLELSGTYQETKDKREGFEDIEPGYSPKFLGYIKASYFFNKNISFALVGNYVGEMESLWDKDAQERYGKRVGSYFLLGANLRLRNLFGTGLFLNIRGSNLLDEEVHYPTTSNNTWADRGTLGRGPSFLVTLGWKF